jgi:hypothetical protein
VRGYLNEAILALDWEQPGTQNNVSWAKAWLDEVYRLTGVKPLIYMSASVVSAYDWSVVANADYGLWIAGYPDLRSSWDLPDFCYSTGAWKFYALWQFTNSHGSLDRDVFMGDARAWKLYAKVYEKKQATPENAELLVERELVDFAAPKNDGVEVKVRTKTKAKPKAKKPEVKESAKAEPKVESKKPATKKKSGEEYYTIQKGDTLFGISLRFHTDIVTLCVWNNIMDPDLIYAGDTIRVR